jgi:hypothetical protein
VSLPRPFSYLGFGPADENAGTAWAKGVAKYAPMYAGEWDLLMKGKVPSFCVCCVI